MNRELKKMIDQTVDVVSSILNMPSLEKELGLKGNYPQIVSMEMALLPMCMIAMDNTISEDEAKALSYYFDMGCDYITMNEMAYSSSVYSEAQSPKVPAMLQILVAFDNSVNESDPGSRDIPYASILYLNTITEIAKETKSMLRTKDGRGVEFAIRYMMSMTDYIKSNLNKRDQNPKNDESTMDQKQKGMTLSQKNAIRSAKDYLDGHRGYSRTGLINQLSSEYGEAFPMEDAVFAIDYLEKSNQVDWDQQAAFSAETYLENRAYSRKGLYDQLISEYGEGFTPEQAEHGLKAVGY